MNWGLVIWAMMVLLLGFGAALIIAGGVTAMLTIATGSSMMLTAFGIVAIIVGCVVLWATYRWFTADV